MAYETLQSLGTDNISMRETPVTTRKHASEYNPPDVPLLSSIRSLGTQGLTSKQSPHPSLPVGKNPLVLLYETYPNRAFPCVRQMSTPKENALHETNLQRFPDGDPSHPSTVSSVANLVKYSRTARTLSKEDFGPSQKRNLDPLKRGIWTLVRSLVDY